MMGKTLQLVGAALVIGLVVIVGERLFLRPPEPELQAAGAAGGEAAPAGERELVLKARGGLSFMVKVEVNGETMQFLVNPRAAMTMLRKADARRLGFKMDELDFTEGNLMARGKPILEADVTLDEVRIGPLSVRGVEARVVDPGGLVSVLGQSFLDALEGYYEVRGKELVLRF